MDDDNVIKITNENMKLTVDSKDNMALSPNYGIDKVYIWGYELCKGSEWKDFLKVVNKLGAENEELKHRLKSQPAEIVDKIKAYYNTSIYNRPEAHTKVKVLFSRLDTILKEYQK
jgi:hypothetical protein